jgi:predicted RNase H-like HicB family nuclease
MSHAKRNPRRVSGKRTIKSSIPVETYTFTVLFEPDEDGFIVASIPALPGCFTQGRTHEEATTNIREAATAYLESLCKDGEPLPRESGEEVIGRGLLKRIIRQAGLSEQQFRKLL